MRNNKFTPFEPDPPANTQASSIATLDPQTARRLITRFNEFPHGIGLMFTVIRTVDVISTQSGFFQGPYVIETPRLFFQANGIRITADDPGTPVRIKRKLKQISALVKTLASQPERGTERAHGLIGWSCYMDTIAGTSGRYQRGYSRCGIYPQHQSNTVGNLLSQNLAGPKAAHLVA
jgi:hypothetical protein